MHLESISARVSPLFHRPGLEARVESAFAEAVNLVTTAGAALALVSQHVGNGPLNAVVSHPQALALLCQDDVVRGDGQWLHLGQGWRLALAPAVTWDPYPEYSRLARWPQIVARNVDWLRRRLPLAAPQASLAAQPIASIQGAFGSRPSVALVQAKAGALADGLIQAYHQGDLVHVAAFSGRLAGLGPGLTPAGDDWLAGWLVGLRAVAAINGTEPPLAVNAVGRAVISSARDRTSRLSLAFLQAAADGAVAQPWHDLLVALPDANPNPIRHAAAEIMRYGATSGSDMLAGFLAAPFPSFP
ncbi:MAG TPA: DUF2877 domain-containing protein [Anaerolineae bacterium]|nr:DUF2877 domain-containing protein [Anaerolineae bacterium]